MPSVHENFKAAIQQAGYSLTNPRLSVFNVLFARGTQSLHELTLAIPDVDRSTIYRTIGLFEQLGIVQRLQIGWKYKLELSDRFTHHHHHAICTRCGMIIDLPETPEIERQLRQLAGNHNFSMQDHQLEIRGLCANCQV